MPELNDFDMLCKYVEQNGIKEILEPVLRYVLLLYGCKEATDMPYEELKDALNALSMNKYNFALGDQIESQVIDIKENIKEYIYLYNNIFKDDISRNTLFNILLYRLTYAVKYVVKAYSHASVQYFDYEVARYRENCIYVDCGGFDGATAVEFSLNCPDYNRIYIYEPLKKYFNQCNEVIKELGLKNVIVKNAAVYDQTTILNFEENIPGCSRVKENGGLKVNAVSLDEDISEPVDFIKMDIEGSEQNALVGAVNHIKNDFPMLAVCVYHKADDIWKIPKMIIETRPGYIFYLRHHSFNTTDETVLYAVPDNLLKKDNKTNHYAGLYKYLQNIKKAGHAQFIRTAAFFAEQYENYYMDSFIYNNGIEKLKKWINELEDAKAYFLGQIQELQGWTKELEGAKAYLEEQLQNCQENSKNQEKVITELQGWTKELEGAKAYLEGLLSNVQKENSELQDKYARIEDELNNLSNEIAKLRYKYNQLINDPIIKMILKIKKLGQ